jgi:RimJ/RimL family protein N-acetyltransferase
MDRHFLRAVIRHHRGVLVWMGIAAVASMWWIYATYCEVRLGASPIQLNCGSVAKPRSETNSCLSALRDAGRLRFLCVIFGATALVQLAVYAVRLMRRPPALETGANVHLRATAVGDAQAVHDTMDEVVLAENRMTPADRMLRKKAVRWFLGSGDLAICENTTGRVVGVISANKITPHDEVVLGMWLGAPHRGNGWASEAVTLLVSILHGKGFETVVAETSQENIAMQTSLRRAGFQLNGLVSHSFTNGETIEAQRYVWTASVGGITASH